jgi:hypothetical protein
MRDNSVDRNLEDVERCKRAQNADETLGQNRAVAGKVIHSYRTVGRDLVRDSEIGHEPQHAGDLKAAQKQVELFSILCAWDGLVH